MRLQSTVLSFLFVLLAYGNAYADKVSVIGIGKPTFNNTKRMRGLNRRTRSRTS